MFSAGLASVPGCPSTQPALRIALTSLTHNCGLSTGKHSLLSSQVDQYQVHFRVLCFLGHKQSHAHKHTHTHTQTHTHKHTHKHACTHTRIHTHTHTHTYPHTHTNTHTH